MTAPWPPTYPPPTSCANPVADPLTQAAERATDLHERLLHQKTLELLLASMIARQGIRATRRALLHHARHLREFHT